MEAFSQKKKRPACDTEEQQPATRDRDAEYAWYQDRDGDGIVRER
ncbi:excalibur calcium-binding domain-containing protein [Nonomuraea sp. NPDC049714]